MDYRLLPREEFESVAPIYAKYGSVPPTQDMNSQIAVASEKGIVAGIMGAQSVMHLEGLWTDPRYSGMVNYRRLYGLLARGMPVGTEFYAFAPTHTVARICAYTRMEPVTWKVYRGRA